MQIPINPGKDLVGPLHSPSGSRLNVKMGNCGPFSLWCDIPGPLPKDTCLTKLLFQGGHGDKDEGLGLQ